MRYIWCAQECGSLAICSCSLYGMDCCVAKGNPFCRLTAETLVVLLYIFLYVPVAASYVPSSSLCTHSSSDRACPPVINECPPVICERPPIILCSSTDIETVRVLRQWVPHNRSITLNACHLAVSVLSAAQGALTKIP